MDEWVGIVCNCQAKMGRENRGNWLGSALGRAWHSLCLKELHKFDR